MLAKHIDKPWGTFLTEGAPKVSLFFCFLVERECNSNRG